MYHFETDKTQNSFIQSTEVEVWSTKEHILYRIAVFLKEFTMTKLKFVGENMFWKSVPDASN